MLGRLYTISVITYQQTVRQPIYYIILFASAVLLFIAAPFTLFSFGKELSMMREVGLATIIFAGIVIAVLSASFSVGSEIEKQTTLITLTKPLSRSEFIVGKFLGIITAIFLATLFLSITFLIIYWIKEGKGMIQENLEAGRYLVKGKMALWEDTFKFLDVHGLLLLKGSYAAFLVVTIITAVSVTLSLFFSLPITAGSVVIFFVVGHISPYFYFSLSKKDSLLINIPAEIFYTLLPNFAHFNISSQVATLTTVSLTYLVLISLYAIAWNAIILTIASLFFYRYEIK